MQFSFKHQPLDIVRIPAFSCTGRIQDCAVGAARIVKYNVEFAINGDFKNHWFYEDEIEKVKS